MVRLSVNVNKVATLRNARGGRSPSVVDAVKVCIDAGAPGITVHPRADQRHITPDDVREIAALLKDARPHVEYNIEGDPRPDLIALVHEVQPDQCTLVPVLPGEITSQAGWQPGAATERVGDIARELRSRGIRVSLFVDAVPDRMAWAAASGADRVELYTEPFARAFADRGAGSEEVRRALATYVDAARAAHALGLGVNAGHDLDLDNLPLFLGVPFLDEVSIGHAIMSRALFAGLGTVVGEYLRLLDGRREARA
jgi:pyridoxine 5-phosphate synthase